MMSLFAIMVKSYRRAVSELIFRSRLLESVSDSMVPKVALAGA